MKEKLKIDVSLRFLFYIELYVISKIVFDFSYIDLLYFIIINLIIISYWVRTRIVEIISKK